MILDLLISLLFSVIWNGSISQPLSSSLYLRLQCRFPFICVELFNFFLSVYLSHLCWQYILFWITQCMNFFAKCFQKVLVRLPHLNLSIRKQRWLRFTLTIPSSLFPSPLFYFQGCRLWACSVVRNQGIQVEEEPSLWISINKTTKKHSFLWITEMFLKLLLLFTHYSHWFRSSPDIPPSVYYTSLY